SLALGIGAATTLYSAMHALVLGDESYPNSEEGVFIQSRPGMPPSRPDFIDIREQHSGFSEIGVYYPAPRNVGLDPVEMLFSIEATPGIVRALGVAPVLGRCLNEEDGMPGAAPVVVISHRLWRRAFGEDPGI